MSGGASSETNEANKESVEREIKVAVDDRTAIRSVLLEHGAQIVKDDVFERNWVLDRDDELRSSKCLLRLRSVGGSGGTITYKGRASFEGGVKVREELESQIGDAERTLEILGALGYSVVTRYEKYREEWRLEDSLVVLDETPIGHFVEVEGGDPETIAKRLGLDLARAEEDSYLELYESHKQRHPEAPPHMVFVDRDDPRSNQ